MTSKITKFIETLEAKVEEAGKLGQAVPITNFAKEIAPSFGWDWKHAYNLIGIFLSEHPEYSIKHGKNGGMVRDGNAKSSLTDDGE